MHVGANAAGEPNRPAPNFTLVDQHGRHFELARQRGRPVVLFFGYTHCPDECPTILANLEHARASLGSAASDLIVALITVDPERDGAAQLGRYVAQFDPTFLGLRGDRAQLTAVYRSYRIRFTKRRAGDDDYLVSHSAFVYYIGRDGRLRGYGTWGDSVAILREELKDIATRVR